MRNLIKIYRLNWMLMMVWDITFTNFGRTFYHVSDITAYYFLTDDRCGVSNHTAPGEVNVALDYMAAILQTTYSNTFSWTKIYFFWVTFHWSLFLRVRLTISRHWLRKWLGAIIWINDGLFYWCTDASLALDESMVHSEYRAHGRHHQSTALIMDEADLKMLLGAPLTDLD